MLLGADFTQEIRFGRNLSVGAHCFLLGPFDKQRICDYAATEKLTIGAFFHSHSRDLHLSSEDLVGFRCSAVPWMVIVLRRERLFYKIYSPWTAPRKRDARQSSP